MRRFVKQELLVFGLGGLLLSSAALSGCDRRTEPSPEQGTRPSQPAREEQAPAAPGAERTTVPAVGEREPATAQPTPTDQIREAEADLEAAEGVELDGKAKLEKTAEGVRVMLEVEDAKPGKYGVHIHEKGDCSDIPGQSMGEHFNPQRHEHGLPTEDKRHLGDLGNITVGNDGKGRLEMTVREATLERGGKMSFLGKALVVHSTADKGTGKAGDAGNPIACAVIESD